MGELCYKRGRPGPKHHVRIDSLGIGLALVPYAAFTSSSQIHALEARSYFTRVVLSQYSRLEQDTREEILNAQGAPS